MISKIASKDFLKKNSYLIFLIIFSVTITTLSIYNNMVQEILGHSYRDIYFYLIEALRFSGVEIGGYSYVNHLSPLIPFLTSLLFRLGFVSEVSIFFVSGIFYIIGVLGVYFLLKLRFNKILSTFGAILFGGLSVTLIWTANGTIDIPSVALSIFALYFMILGVYKNQNYFYLAFPIFSLGFFAKYPAALILIIMMSFFLFYLISNQTLNQNTNKTTSKTITINTNKTTNTKRTTSTNRTTNTNRTTSTNKTINTNKATSTNRITTIVRNISKITNISKRTIQSTMKDIKKYYKKGSIGLILGILTALPFLLHFYINKIPLGFINQAQEIATKASVNYQDPIGNQIFYYFIRIPHFIYFRQYIISYIIIAILIIGLGIGLYKFVDYLKNNYKFNENNRNSRNNRNDENNSLKTIKILYISLIISILIIIALFLNVDNISFIYSEILFFIAILGFSYIINKIVAISNYKNSYFSNNNKKFNYDLMMFTWFFSYMIFFSSHLIKVDRYFVTLAPPFVFFVVCALNIILKTIEKKNIQNKNKNNEKNNNISNNNENNTSNTTKNIKKTIPILLIAMLTISSFYFLTLDKHDPVVGDEREMVKWFVKYDPNYKEKVIWADRGPIFTWYLQKEVIYMNWLVNPEQLSVQMLENNTDYYITINPAKQIPYYTKIKEIGEIAIYKRDNSS